LVGIEEGKGGKKKKKCLPRTTRTGGESERRDKSQIKSVRLEKGIRLNGGLMETIALGMFMKRPKGLSNLHPTSGRVQTGRKVVWQRGLFAFGNAGKSRRR